MLLGERTPLLHALRSSTPSSPSSSRWPPTSRRRSSGRARASSSTPRLLGTFARRERAPAPRSAARWRAPSSRLAPGGRRGEAAGRRGGGGRPAAPGRPSSPARRGRTSSPSAHVQAALDAQVRRASWVRERIHEEIWCGTLLIDTEGGAVGQVNGLGGAAARRPRLRAAEPHHRPGAPRRAATWWTSSARSALGGPIHSKGVLILAGFLGGATPPSRRWSLSASLAFEQSYAAIEGDSASCGELCALLSALAEAPDPPGAGDDRLGEPARRGAGHRRGEREDRGLLRRVPGAGLTGDQGVIIPART